MNQYLVDAPLSWDNPDARNQLYYRDRDHQQLQHVAVAARLPSLSGLSLFDFGCGYGDFTRWLPDDCDYLGVDANRNAIEEARRLHPDRRFLTSRAVYTADVIVAIATVQCGVADPARMVAQFHRKARLLTVFTCTTKFTSGEQGLAWCPGPAELFPSEDDFFTVVMRP